MYIKGIDTRLSSKWNQVWCMHEVTTVSQKQQDPQNILRAAYASAGNLLLPLNKQVPIADCLGKSHFLDPSAGIFH